MSTEDCGEVIEFEFSDGADAAVLGADWLHDHQIARNPELPNPYRASTGGLSYSLEGIPNSFQSNAGTGRCMTHRTVMGLSPAQDLKSMRPK